MKHINYIILTTLLILIAAFFLNADFALGRVCAKDSDCGANQTCLPDERICADYCPPLTKAHVCNPAWPIPAEDNQLCVAKTRVTEVKEDKICYTCVNYTCIQLEQPLPPVPGTQIASLDTYIKYIYQIALGLVGLFALIMLVMGGVIYMTAAGNASQMDDAKDRIKNAILGLILALAAYLILYTINPDLVRLKPVQLSYPLLPEVILSCENNICKAKTIAPQDVTPDTKNTCGKVGTECPPNCKLISASLKPDIIKAPANASNVDENIEGAIELRGLCEDKEIIITSFVSKSKFPGLFSWTPGTFGDGQEIFTTSIKNLASAKFKKGFPYDTWTFNFRVGIVGKVYWFTASLIEQWSDTETHTTKVNEQFKVSTPVMIRKSD